MATKTRFGLRAAALEAEEWDAKSLLRKLIGTRLAYPDTEYWFEIFWDGRRATAELDDCRFTAKAEGPFEYLMYLSPCPNCHVEVPVKVDSRAELGKAIREQPLCPACQEKQELNADS